MKYIVEITETLQKQISVEAKSREDARRIAQDIYCEGKEILTAADLKETTFETLYDIKGSLYTIAQLRQMFVEATKTKDIFTDKEIFVYMKYYLGGNK